MHLKYFLLLISITNAMLCIRLKTYGKSKNIKTSNTGRHNLIRGHMKGKGILKKKFFLSKSNNCRRTILSKYYMNSKYNNEVGKGQKDIVDEEDISTFDEYFNKKAEENYTKLEAEKLKILKENVSTYKEEIRKILRKSYKDEYKKLIKEEEEDNNVSQKVHENLKITFLMKENINNFLFTQYSYMINKLKERSVILKSMRNFYKKGDSSTGEGHIAMGEGKSEERSSGDIGDIRDADGNADGDANADRGEDADEGANEYPQLGKLIQGKNSSSSNGDPLIENVNFFKPEKNYAQARKCSTFSEQMFANTKIESAKLLLDVKEEKDKITKEDLISDDEEEGKKLFSKNNISALQLFKENVKSCLHYKNENIITGNLNEDILCGRVKVHWFPKFMKRVITKIPEYIKMSDIIIEVRNGIIPFVFDDLYALNMFDIHTNKPKIIVYTNCDRSSLKGNEEWGNYYRRKLYWYDKKFNKNINKEYMMNQMKKSAVIFVDAKNGKKEIIVLKKLINRLCQHIIESKKKKGLYNYKVKCIFLGLPNVGKSALINRILELKKTKSYDHPGLTTNINMYATKKYELIDTPGILSQNLYKLREKQYNKNNMILEKIYNCNNSNDYSIDNVVNIKNYNSYMHVENNIYLLALCNHISPKMYDIYNIAEVLMQNLYNAYLYDNEYIDLQKIIKRYQINFTECVNCEGKFSPYHFIQKLARDRFHNDINQASMRLVTDFRKNYLGRLTLNYPLYFNRRSITLRVSREFVRQQSDKYVGW
ncbi:ribosome biogenesis GTPase A, putative (RbgA) [Plasmodium malariae]|uniref:Ribosome biogenesis GTPase A, putative (RbgA) n=1 Tax=Plasmodium malariae TaxID=5858 RepID=A0A1A8VN45_PLAMA|nr:ribosome biogenesis GTPase A, putative (RbgA) [Plasmodium malariae]